MIAGFLVMRHDHTVAVAKVTAIAHLDQTGPVPTATMSDLQKYVSDHMGSSVAFRLTGAYTRDLAAAKAANSSTASGAIYQQAQAACASIKVATQQAQCNEQYISSHLQSENIPTPVPTPQLASYTYNLSSPLWTPDLAGFLFVVSVIFLLTTAWRLLLRHS